MMGGQVGLVDHLNVGDDAIFIAQSGVIGDILLRPRSRDIPPVPIAKSCERRRRCEPSLV